MKYRRRSEIEQEVVELLSQRECIGDTIRREIGINSKLSSKILAKLDERGILIKESKPSHRNNIPCIHYHISSLKETKE